MNSDQPFHIVFLKPVSRSFYLSLRVLPEPLRPPMGLGYLFCRMADTLADAVALPLDQRLALLKDVEALVRPFPLSLDRLKTFAKNLSEMSLNNQTPEGRLLNQFEHCIPPFQNLSPTDQALVQEVVEAVIQGMIMDLTALGDSLESLKALETKTDLEKYLGWIGGAPGRFWTNLCRAHFPTLGVKNHDKWMEDGFQFGKGLQMINILRDLRADLKNGRCYIPMELLLEHGLTLANLVKAEKKEVFLTLYHQLIDDTIGRLRAGLTYLSQIPWPFMRLRAAVWWPLVIGLKTLDQLRSNPDILTTDQTTKIKRRELYHLMGFSLMVLPFNALLEAQFRNLAGRASSSMGTRWLR